MIIKSNGLIHNKCPECDQILNSETWSTLSDSSFCRNNPQEEKSHLKHLFSERKGIPPQFLSTCSIGLHLYSTHYEPTFNLRKCPQCSAILWLDQMDLALKSNSNEEWLSFIVETITAFFLEDIDSMTQNIEFANNFLQIQSDVFVNSDQVTKEAILKCVEAFNTSALNNYPEHSKKKPLLLEMPIFNSDIPESKAYSELTLDDYYCLLEKGIDDVIKERYIRNWIWIEECEKKASRQKRVPIPSRLADNLKELSRLLDNNDIADRIRKAEILRELELFDEARTALPSHIEIKGIYSTFVSTIKTLIDENDSKIKHLLLTKIKLIETFA